MTVPGQCFVSNYARTLLLALAALIACSHALPAAQAQIGNQKPFQSNSGQNLIWHDPDSNPDSKPNRKTNKKNKVTKKSVDPSSSSGASAQSLAPDNTLIEETVTSEGMDRQFYIHVPKGYDHSARLPLVICFHGGFALGARMDSLTGFETLSDQQGFLLVYPQGINRHWNDGRNIDGHDRYNDVQFFQDMLAHLERRWNIDPQRVYVAGISNGGFFAQYLSLLLPTKIAACASVAAPLPDIIHNTRKPLKPMSVIYFLGMSDPLVPFRGGPIHYKSFHDRGSVMSAADSTQFWVKGNRCNEAPRTLELPDLDPNDGTRVKYAQFSGGRGGSEVVVYGIEGGGHTWPGGRQYASEGTVGKTSRDINASEIIWEFFKNHSAPRQ